MEPVKDNPKISQSSKTSGIPRMTDPVVIGTSALLVGYAIGTGRWNWLAQSTAKISQSLGNLTLLHLYQSFQKHNPQLFTQKPRITH